MEKRIKSILWFGVATLVLGIVVYLADISRFISAITSAKTIYLLPALVFGILPFGVYAFGWYRFLNKVGHEISYLESLRLFFGGHFLNAVTPLGQFGGEPFMAYIIKDNTGLRYEEAFSVVLSSDIVNAIPTFTFVIGGSLYLLFLGGLKDLILQLLSIALMVVFIGGSIAYLLWFKSGVIENAILSFLKVLVDLTGRGKEIYRTVEQRFEGVQEAFAVIGDDPKHLFITAIVAHFEFIFSVFCLYTVLFSFGVSVDLAPLYIVMAFAGIANFAPTPGGSGAFEVALAGLISIFIGVELAIAVAVAIVFRLMTYWPGLLIGYGAILSLRSER